MDQAEVHDLRIIPLGLFNPPLKFSPQGPIG